jgi:hypothetical protein
VRVVMQISFFSPLKWNVVEMLRGRHSEYFDLGGGHRECVQNQILHPAVIHGHRTLKAPHPV